MVEPGDIEIEEDRIWIEQPKEGLEKINEQVIELNKELGNEVYKVDEIRLGFLINNAVRGDDLNALAAGVSYQESPQLEKPYYYSSAKRKILGRLDWEINSGIPPERLKIRLQETRDEFVGSEWNRDNFMKLYNLWKTKVLDFVKQDPELSRVEKIYQQFKKDYGKRKNK